MSTTVNRYSISEVYKKGEYSFVEHKDKYGNYVKYEDYESLSSEVDVLKDLVKSLKDSLTSIAALHMDVSHMDLVVQNDTLIAREALKEIEKAGY